MTDTTSRYATIGLGLAGAVLLAILLVQNIFQAGAITSLETRVAELQIQVSDSRKAAGATAPRGAPAERARAGKARGKAKARGERPPQRGDRVARDPLAEGARGGGAGGGGKAGKRRAAPTDEAYE